MALQTVASERREGTRPTDSVTTIVTALRATFEGGGTRPIDWRLNQLERLAALVSEQESDLSDALRADLGKPPFESWLGELSLLNAEVTYTRKRLRSWMRPERVRTPLAIQPGKSRIVREPLGVVLIIGPWNYPIQLVLAPLIGAIAAGNCAVLKPSELTPRSSSVLAELIPKYLDTSAVTVVEGGVKETGALLAQRFNHIFYTGGGVVGRIVMEAASKHLTPVTLELGGKTPCIVDRDIDLPVVARRIVWGKFFNTGQTCVAPDYVLAHKEIEQPLIEALRRTITEFYGQNPKASPDYGRIVNDRHFQRLVGLLSDGETVAGGERDEKQRYIAPTILRGVKPDSKIMADEIFGPILPVLSVNDVSEAISFVNARPNPLALYVFSKDRLTAQQIVERTSSGGACVNDVVAHLGVPGLPFGGVGASGMGAYHGRASFETFSHRKSVLTKGTLIDPSLRYPPYTDNKTKWARRLV